MASATNVFTGFLSYVAREKAVNTFRTYSGVLAEYASFLRGEAPEAANAQAFIDRCADRGLSGATLGHKAAAIRSYFEYTTGVAPRLSYRRSRRRLPVVLNKQQVMALLGACRSRYERAMMMGLYGAGLRISEFLGLKRRDIDRRGYIKVLQKGGDEGVVPVEGDVVRALLEAAGTQEKVFPYGADKAREMLKALCYRASVPVVSPHSLRHSAATVLLEEGASIYDVQQFVRHKNIGTTTIYLHLTPVALKQRLPKLVGD